MNTLFLVISVIYLVASNDAARLSKDDQKITLRGRIIFPEGSPMPIESGGVLNVELQDTSLADAPAKIIARGTGKAIRFPMAFAVKYSPRQIVDGKSYSLHVSIRNNKNELLYINDVRIRVTPTGPRRTTLIDVPVILVKKSTEKVSKKQWPELVGENGQEAVNIIKKETGFKNVITVADGSMVTLDYRMNRVRVFIDGKGIVKTVPIVA